MRVPPIKTRAHFYLSDTSCSASLIESPPAATSTWLSFLCLSEQTIVFVLAHSWNMLFLTLRFVLFSPGGGSMSNRQTIEITSVCHRNTTKVVFLQDVAGCGAARCNVCSSFFFGFSVFTLHISNPTSLTIPSCCSSLQVSVTPVFLLSCYPWQCKRKVNAVCDN